MARWFVSRHPGARAWAQEQGIEVDLWVEHLDVADVQAGDVVMGTLPVEAAAALCERGVRFFALCIELERADRGRELSSDEVRRMRGRLEEFCVRRCD